jgi:predicted esterase
VAVGGDVPPELSSEVLARAPLVLLARGTSDEWYTKAKWEGDQGRLREAGVDVNAVGFEGGHEWHDEVNRSAAALLERAGR